MALMELTARPGLRSIMNWPNDNGRVLYNIAVELRDKEPQVVIEGTTRLLAVCGRHYGKAAPGHVAAAAAWYIAVTALHRLLHVVLPEAERPVRVEK